MMMSAAAAHRGALACPAAVWCALAGLAAPRALSSSSSASAAEPARHEHGDTLGRLLKTQLADIRAAGTYTKERVITSGQEAEIRVEGRQGTVLNMCGTRGRTAGARALSGARTIDAPRPFRRTQRTTTSASRTTRGSWRRRTRAWRPTGTA